jgi:hypothetical protein
MRALVAVLSVVAVLAAACVGDDAAVPAEAPPPAPAPSLPAPQWPPVPPLEPVPPLDARVLATDLSGVRVIEGWDPNLLFPAGRGPWARGSTGDGLSELLLGTRPVPEGAVHIDVEAELELDPAACFSYDRRVRAVRVDVAGSAGRQIEAMLLAEATARSSWLDEFRDGSIEEEDRRWCEEYFDGEPVGFHLVEIGAEACGYPDGPALLCASAGVWGYHLGARDFWYATTYVFDVATGDLLDTAQVLAPYDREAIVDLFVRIDAEVDIPHLTWASADLRLGAEMTGVDVVPTIEGMRWRWSPWHPITGSIDVVVPWDVLDGLRRMEDVGPD